MMKRKCNGYKHIDFLILDIIILFVSYGIALLWKSSEIFPQLKVRYTAFGGLILLGYLIVVAFWRVHSGILRQGKMEIIKHAVALNAGIYVIISFFIIITKSTEDYSRTVIMLFFILDTFLMSAGHILLGRLLWTLHNQFTEVFLL